MHLADQQPAAPRIALGGRNPRSQRDWRIEEHRRGHDALRPVRYLPEREARLPPADRTRFKGALRDWEIAATNEQPTLTLRVAYIHSSEEATQVRDARERALEKAEDALTRMRNGLGGRYYKTREQLERRIGQIIASNQTNRAGETFYTFDIRGAQGTQRVTVDASHGKVMAVIPLTQ